MKPQKTLLVDRCSYIKPPCFGWNYFPGKSLRNGIDQIILLLYAKAFFVFIGSQIIRDLVILSKKEELN